jgi:hypothetical protein
VVLAVLIGVLPMGVLAACGGDGDGGGDEAGKAPTTVRAEDLERDGAFWRSLTPDLKDSLIGLGKDQLAEERPDGASGIRAYKTAELVAEVEKQYTNVAKQDRSIYETYRLANDQLARQALDGILNEMDELCQREDAPAECGP